MASHEFERALSGRVATEMAQSKQAGNKWHEPQRCHRALRDFNKGSIKLDLDNNKHVSAVTFYEYIRNNSTTHQAAQFKCSTAPITTPSNQHR